MRRAASHLFSNKAKIALVSKLSKFYFDLRPPGQTEEQGASGMCESPGAASPGGQMVSIVLG